MSFLNNCFVYLNVYDFIRNNDEEQQEFKNDLTVIIAHLNLNGE